MFCSFFQKSNKTKHNCICYVVRVVGAHFDAIDQLCFISVERKTNRIFVFLTSLFGCQIESVSLSSVWWEENIYFLGPGDGAHKDGVENSKLKIVLVCPSTRMRGIQNTIFVIEFSTPSFCVIYWI